jgi:hypothetical protein
MNGRNYGEGYIKALKLENENFQQQIKSVEAKIATFEGIDLDEYRRLENDVASHKVELENINLKELANKGEWDALRARLDIQHQVEIEDLEDRLAEVEKTNKMLKVELDETIIAHEIDGAISAAGAINPSLLRKVVDGMIRLEPGKDGKRALRVVDEQGDTRLNHLTGNTLTAQQLIDDLCSSEDYAHLFATGREEINQPAETEQTNPWKSGSINLTKQAEMLKANPELAKQLQHEARPHITIDTTAIKRGDRPSINPWNRETLNLSMQGQILKINPQMSQQLRLEAMKIMI